MLETSQLTKRELLQGVEGVIYSRKLARNTVLYRLADGTECIKYHDTVVVKKAPDGNVTLNTGGFYTITTKARIEEYAPVRIMQHHGIWYVVSKTWLHAGGYATVWEQMKKGTLPQFNDGMIVSADGTILTETIPRDTKKIKFMKERIKKYVSHITSENLPVPSSGDCWHCMMTDKGKSLGDAIGDTDHLFSHLKEMYIPGALLVNAMRENGYSDDQIRFHYSVKLDVWFKKSVTRYLQRRLIPDIAVG